MDKFWSFDWLLNGLDGAPKGAQEVPRKNKHKNHPIRLINGSSKVQGQNQAQFRVLLGWSTVCKDYTEHKNALGCWLGPLEGHKQCIPKEETMHKGKREECFWHSRGHKNCQTMLSGLFYMDQNPFFISFWIVIVEGNKAKGRKEIKDR